MGRKSALNTNDFEPDLAERFTGLHVRSAGFVRFVGIVCGERRSCRMIR
jgi:hypothetical protein